MKLLFQKLITILGFVYLFFLIPSFVGAGSWDGVPPGYGLAWSDEFNGAVGSLPNAANWNIETNMTGEGNLELEYYNAAYGTANSVIVSDSNAVDGQSLAIIATDPGGNNGIAGSYHSARINTQNKQQYGASQANTYYVARIQMPYEAGTWPAFWSLGANNPTVGWPTCGETDIMENFGAGANPPQLNINVASLHSQSGGVEISQTGQYNLVGPNGIGYNTDYHTFAALCTSSPTSMVQFFIDGQLYETNAQSSFPAGDWPFNQPEYIILNLAIGGNKGTGQPNASTVFPVTMLVDYVRVYQQGKPAPTPVTQSTWRVACGESSNFVSGGVTWAADTNFGFENGGPAYTPNSVSNTTTPQLYQYYRGGVSSNSGGITYSFNVPPGAYQVTLKFSENVWSGGGVRQFNAAINGVSQLANFDIFTDSGGKNAADDKVFNNIAPDANGNIVIQLSEGSSDVPCISAIQIIPQPAPTSSATPTPTATATPLPNGVSVSGNQLIVNCQPFLVKGMNYSPSPINAIEPVWSANFQTSDADFAQMQAMGVNAIRVYFGYSDFFNPDGTPGKPDRRANFARLLQDAYNHGIYVIANYWVNYNTDYTQAANLTAVETQFDAIINLWKTNPDILMWVLGNENNIAANLTPMTSTQLFNFYQTVLSNAKANADSTHPYTVALADTGDITNGSLTGLVPSIDIWSLNYYQSNTGVWNNFFTNYTNAKPVLFTEFGNDAYNTNVGAEDDADQSTYYTNVWPSIGANLSSLNAAKKCVGACAFEWNDEWWKCSGAGTTPLTHDACSGANGTDLPDGNGNAEWYGLSNALATGTSGPRTYRTAFNILQGYWTNSPYNPAFVRACGTSPTPTPYPTATFTPGVNSACATIVENFDNGGTTNVFGGFWSQYFGSGGGGFDALEPGADNGYSLGWGYFVNSGSYGGLQMGLSPTASAVGAGTGMRDISGVAEITFWAADTRAGSVYNLAIVSTQTYGGAGYVWWSCPITLTNAWVNETIPLTTAYFKNPGANTGSFLQNLQNATYIAFSPSTQGVADYLSLDDITFIGAACVPTNTPTPTATNTPAATQTFTPTPPNTSTATPSNTPTGTATNTATQTTTKTATASTTTTPTSSPTFTTTASPSPTATNTPTKTSTNTLTNTPTYSTTPTPTNTIGNTATNSPTSTVTSSPTQTATSTPTNSPTRTATSTATGTSTFSATQTATGTPTSSATLTATKTSSATATNSPTLTATQTATFTATVTPTSTATFTPTLTPTGTLSPVLTNTPTRTATITPTSTPIFTATSTATSTPTFTASMTPSATASHTLTATPSSTTSWTPTVSVTATGTASPTATPTASPTKTATDTATSTKTVTNSPTSSATSTPTSSPANTLTATPTATNSATSTVTSTSTPSATTTGTSTPTATNTPTTTPSPTPTNSWTPSFTPTATATSTITPTFTPTAVTVQASQGSNPPPNSTQLPGASNVLVQQIQLTNPGGNAVTLSGLTLTESGAAATGIISVSLVKNGMVLSTANFSGSTATFSFSDTIAANNGAATYQVTATFSAAAPVGNYQFSMTGGAGNNGQPVFFSNMPVLGATVAITQATPTPTSTFSASPTPTPTPTVGSSIVVLGPFPNPSNGGPVQFEVTAPDDSDVEWSIFTTAFRKITEGKGKIPQGTSRFQWYLRDRLGDPVADGIYYLRVEVRGSQRLTKILKVLVLH